MKAMRFAVALACVGAAASSMASDSARQMSFDEALAAARESPRLARLAAEVSAAEAALVAAGVYPHNPEVEFELADRTGTERSTTDRGAGVSQRLELAGQRGKRRDAAEAALAAARASFRQARIEVLGDVARAFAAAVHRRELLAIEQTEADLAGAFAAMVERRLEAGSATAVELALARAGMARAEHGRARATGSYRAAQAHLAERVGVAEVSEVTPQGELPRLESPPLLDDLLSRVLTQRGDLAAAAARLRAAEARRRLARALRLPDLTVAARVGQEEGDDIAGLSIGVPIPLLDRNQAGIARAEAEIAMARSERDLAQLSARRQLSAAHSRFESALEAQRATEQLGVMPLEEGLALLERSFEAGKIGSAELLLYRRELVEGRRQALAASMDVWEAAMDLAIAAGGVLAGMDWMMDWMDEERSR